MNYLSTKYYELQGGYFVGATVPGRLHLHQLTTVSTNKETSLHQKPRGRMQAEEQNRHICDNLDPPKTWSKHEEILEKSHSIK